MHFDAILPAGGRARRLGGAAKPLLRVAGVSLLERALLAAGSARHIVVVGPENLPIPPGAHQVREDPPFGGPAAAVAAGLDLLRQLGDPAPWLLVLAADQPAAELLVPPLLAAAGAGPAGVQAWIGTDAGGRRQLLTALYATDPLSAAVRRLRKRSPRAGLAGRPFRELIAGLVVREVTLPAAAAGDIDTWADATHWGAIP